MNDTVDATLIFDATDAFGLTGSQRQDWSLWKGMAMAYVWGRQDGGDKATAFSHTFGELYAMAQHLTDHSAGPLQNVYKEWRATGRMLIRLPRTCRVVQLAAYDDKGTERVRAHLAVLADDDYGLPHYYG